MLFYEDDPKPLLPAAPPAIISSITWLSEGQADVCNLWNAGKLVKDRKFTQKYESEHWAGRFFIRFCEI